MTEFPARVDEDKWIAAGRAVARLFSGRPGWIHRRVETIEILTYEETSTRVSVDFTLTRADREQLAVSDSLCVVPVGALDKAPKSHFDFVDESGSSVPAGTKEQNSLLSTVALTSLAARALPPNLDSNTVDEILDEIEQIVVSDGDEGRERALRLARGNESWKRALRADDDFVDLAATLASNYVIYAFLPVDQPDRRVLKYSFGFDGFSKGKETLKDRLARLASSPDGYEFRYGCHGVDWCDSFHFELVIPEEIRAVEAGFVVAGTDMLIDEPQRNADRVSLYFPRGTRYDESKGVEAGTILVPERSGAITTMALVSLLVALVMIAGAWRNVQNIGEETAVSLLLVGVSVIGGVASNRGQHKLVRKVFKGPRIALVVLLASAVAGALCLSFWEPCERPGWLWLAATVCATLSFLRMGWSWKRAARP